MAVNKIFDCSCHDPGVFVKMPYRGIASVAEDASRYLRTMSVVDIFGRFS